MELLFLMLMLSVTYISAENVTYTITAPNTIRPNSDYQIVVTNHGPSEEDLKVNVQVLGQVNQKEGTLEGRNYSESGVITVPDKSTRTLLLKIGNWEPGDYQLLCNGSGAANFSRKAQLEFNDKEFSVLIQMDKSLYQPGQIVHFRIVQFNSNLLPYKNSPLSVYINDANGNRIKQWDNIVPKSGMFEDQLQLSKLLVVGNWVLHAQNRNTAVNKTFLVSEYTLPKFEVTVKSSQSITPDDDQFPVTVSAQYPDGGKVIGTYELNVTNTSCIKQSIATCTSKQIVSNGEIKGSAPAVVRVGDLNLDKSAFNGGSLTVVAVITEKITGIKRNSSTIVTLQRSTQKLEIEHAANFKPEKDFSFTVKLLRQNGKPVSPSPLGPVNITVEYGDEIDPVVIVGEFGNDGTLSKTVVPPENAKSLIIKVLYKGLTGNGCASLPRSSSLNFVTLSVENKKPKVGDEITVKVDAPFTFNIPLSYQVVGREGIAIAKTELLTSSSDSFSFNLTRDMAPNVRIIGFYVTSKGNIVGDSIDVSVEGVLQNQVKLNLSNIKTEPGNTVTIDIDCKPDSIVGLLAVDQKLPRSRNDITKQDILNELKGYGLYEESSDPIFGFAGLQLFTNGDVSEENTCAKPKIPPETDNLQPNQLAIQKENFAEVGLWISTTTNNNGTAKLTYTVPATMNTWAISALAMNDNDGIGTTDVSSTLTVTRKYYIVVEKPEYVFQNEKVTIKVKVFNNLDQDLSSDVTLNKTENPSAYEILDPAVENSNFAKRFIFDNINQPSNTSTKRIKIGANDVQILNFHIQPKELGDIDLDFKAFSPLAGDRLKLKLSVKAQGFPQYKVQSIFVDLRKTTTYSTRITLNIPPEVIEGSQFIQCSAIGDIMATVIVNIEVLLRIPAGCGEQNMLYFVPDIVILKYLKVIGQLTVEFEKKALSYLEIGYQNQLVFKRPDGSYHAFPYQQSPTAHGSTWLTAYIVRSFSMGEEYITIDPNVIKVAKQFVASKQLDDGQFREDGMIFHKAMQGGTLIGLSNTAFVLISLIENKKEDDFVFDAVINKAVKYLEINVDSAKTTYELAITTYALHLAKSPMRNELLTKLMAKKKTQNDFTYWTYSTTLSSPTYDIETTAYALLVINFHQEIKTDVILPILRWLISKQSSLGGYESSQETVMAIQALATVGARFAGSRDSSVRVNLTYTYVEDTTFLIIKHLKKQSVVFNLNMQNALEFQKVQLPKETEWIDINAVGNGVGILQCAWNYNTRRTMFTKEDFKLTYVVTVVNEQIYSVNIRISSKNNDTNMVLVEFDTLSGYVLDVESFPRPGFPQYFSHVETENKATRGIFYFEKMVFTPNTLNFTVNVIKTFDVAELKKATIRVYDYYEPSKQSTTSYDLEQPFWWTG